MELLQQDLLPDQPNEFHLRPIRVRQFVAYMQPTWIRLKESEVAEHLAPFGHEKNHTRLHLFADVRQASCLANRLYHAPHSGKPFDVCLPLGISRMKGPSGFRGHSRKMNRFLPA